MVEPEKNIDIVIESKPISIKPKLEEKKESGLNLKFYFFILYNINLAKH